MSIIEDLINIAKRLDGQGQLTPDEQKTLKDAEDINQSINTPATGGAVLAGNTQPTLYKAKFRGYARSNGQEPLFDPGQDIIVIDQGEEDEQRGKIYIGVASEKDAEEHLKGGLVDGDELTDGEFEIIEMAA